MGDSEINKSSQRTVVEETLNINVEGVNRSAATHELFVQDKCVCKLQAPRNFYKKHTRVKNPQEVFGGFSMIGEIPHMEHEVS